MTATIKECPICRAFGVVPECEHWDMRIKENQIEQLGQTEITEEIMEHYRKLGIANPVSPGTTVKVLLSAYRGQNDYLRARVEKLEAALQHYGQHRFECDALCSGPCSCGLIKALAKPKGE